jgi:hypothetical protein
MRYTEETRYPFIFFIPSSISFLYYCSTLAFSLSRLMIIQQCRRTMYGKLDHVQNSALAEWRLNTT